MEAGYGWIKMGITKILQLSALAILYGFAAFFCDSAEEAANRTYLLLEEPIWSVQAENIFTQEAALSDSMGFCFWGEADSAYLSCNATGGVAEVKQFLISGNPELLGVGVLAWQEGCFLDQKTAQSLFCTDDCNAQTILLGSRQYTVFGTLPAVQPTILRTAESADGAVLNRCVLASPAENGKEMASQFMIRWGLQGSTIDFYALWAVTFNMLLTLPTFMLLHFAVYGIRKVRNIAFPGRIKYLLLLIALIGMLFGIWKQIIILPDMIPNRWSDFSFWGRWWDEQWKNFQMVLRTPMSEGHLQMMLDMVKSILSSTAAMLLSMWTFRRQTDEDTAD